MPVPFQLNSFKNILADSPIAYRLARGAFWSLIGAVVSRTFVMFSSIIVARLLGKEGFGGIGMVQSTVGVFGIIAGFGLGLTLTKYIAEYRLRDPNRASRICGLVAIVSLLSSCFTTIIYLVMLPWLDKSILNHPDLSAPLAASSLLLFISTLGGVYSAALAGFEAYREYAKINVLQGVAAPLVAIPCVWFYGLEGAVTSLTINAAIGLVLCMIVLKKEYEKYRIPVKFSKEIWRESSAIWNFALPGMISGLTIMPATWLANLILVNQPGGYGELGLFNAANQWRNAIMFVPLLLNVAMVPILSETFGRDDRTDFKRTISLNFNMTLVVALPLTLIFITLRDPLAALFGKEFVGSGNIISLVMVSSFLTIVCTVLGSPLIGSGRMWTNTLLNIGWGVTLVLISTFLIPKQGARGLASAYLLAYLIQIIWIIIYLEGKLAPSSVRNQWRLMLFSTVMVTAATQDGILGTRNYLYSVLLIIISSIPILKMLLERYSVYFAYAKKMPDFQRGVKNSRKFCK